MVAQPRSSFVRSGQIVKIDVKSRRVEYFCNIMMHLYAFQTFTRISFVITGDAGSNTPNRFTDKVMSGQVVFGSSVRRYVWNQNWCYIS